MQNVKSEQEVINLSNEKWRWMSERKVDSLAALFHWTLDKRFGKAAPKSLKLGVKS